MTAIDPQRQREFALGVLSELRKHGYQAYWAGGCVRDHLLARPPKDYDVATNATPPQIGEVFRQRRTLEIGAAFGVMVVIGPRKAGNVEVTTFRRDAEYADGRHPDSVTFSSPEEDAQRRDFTINGLFYDPLEDRVIDYVGGVDDLGRRVVRAIGDPLARFREDKLRMLRAVRMAATLSFALDPATLSAIQKMAAEVTVVSAERIAQELRLTLVLPDRAAAVQLLRTSGLLAAIFPELDKPANHDDAWEYTLRVLGTLEQPGFPLALATLWHAAGRSTTDQDHAATILASVQLVEAVALRLKLSNKERERAIWLVRYQQSLDEASRQPWPRIQRLLIAEGIDDLVALHAARFRAAGRSWEDETFCRSRLAWPAEQLNPPPLLGGHDLIHHGLPRGKLFAVLLERVRDAQLEGQARTKEEALRLVDQWSKEGGENDPA